MTIPIPRANSTFVAFEKCDIQQSIPARFEKMVLDHGDRPAIWMDGGQLSYAELNRFSNAIGKQLQESGCNRQEPVAILMAQGSASIAAILGVLKTGNIYVPIDAADPPQRVAALMTEAGARTVVTDSGNVNTLRDVAGPGRQVVNVESIEWQKGRDNLNLTVSPDDAAYIFYTSGSTGRAKGVVDSHRNVLHNIMRYTNNLKVCCDDRLTLLQACNFSGSVSSIFCALLNGATVYPFEVRKNGVDALAQLLVDQELTMYHSVPSLFEQLMNAGRQFPRLRVIRLEGDQCHIRHVETYRQHFGDGCILANGLGATETGLSNQYLLSPDTVVEGSVVPVGNPMDDMEAIILDDEGRVTPTGQQGEIAIRSAYLATGYWGDAELTRTAFTPIAHGQTRQFRTGDVGRVTSGGNLEYLGRKDFRVKIRGHTVNTEAIENAVRNVPGVSHAFIQGHTTWSGHRQLIAYVVHDEVTAGDRQSSEPCDESSLRKQIAARFPSYMVPARFVTLSEVPLDANGKVSRKALPAPGKRRPNLGRQFVEPDSHMEKRIAVIWREVLQIDQIGLDDDFFELGGDSMLAMAMPAEIEKRLAIKMSDAVLLEARTVREVVHVIDRGLVSRCLVAIQPKGSKQPLFCIHGHSGRILEFRDLAEWLGDEQPFYGLQPKGFDGSAPPLSTIEEMAVVYLREIRQVQPNGPYRIAGYCMGALIAYEIARLLRHDRVQDNLIVLIDPDEPRRSVIHKYVSPAYIRQIRSYTLADFASRAGARILKLVRIRNREPRTTVAPVPDSAIFPEHSNIQDANTIAENRYKPKSYDGNVTIVSVAACIKNQSENHAAWKKIITGQVQIVGLLDKGNKHGYRHLFHTPYLELLGDALKKILLGQ